MLSALQDRGGLTAVLGKGSEPRRATILKACVIASKYLQRKQMQECGTPPQQDKVEGKGSQDKQ